jgi:endonuclease/exonuclease/phosphatase family metal-dependent hydrolase
MRLSSYNILDGGEGRADPLAEVLLAQKPDIVVIVEADDADVLTRLGKRLNMDFVRGEGKKGAAAIFSRWTIRDSVNHAALDKRIHKSFLEATILSPAGAEWTIGAVHLSAHAAEENERKREEELKAVLDGFKPMRKSKARHIICGDFNSNSPVQKIDIAKCKKATQEEYAENGNVIPRRVVQKILDAGYIDTLHAFDQTAGESAGTFTTQTPGQRVDYIFAYGIDPKSIRAAWIETDRLAKYASDHFPIGVELAEESR